MYSNGSVLECEDIDECSNGDNNCDLNLSICNNLDGSYECLCNDGLVMDMNICVGRWW